MSKVSIQRDICVNMVVPLTATHNFIPLPPFPPVPPPMPAAPLSLAACAIETIVNAWWPPGYALGANKFTTTVLHSGMTICQAGHDCGKMIPHVQVAPAPNNTLTVLHIAFSSRRANFSASTVLGNGTPLACMTMIAWPPTPMTYCSEPMSMPLASAPTAHLNTVTMGMTFGAWLAGAFAIAATMILEWVLFRRGGGSKGFGKNAGKMIAQSKIGKYTYQMLAPKFVGSLTTDMKVWAMKQGVANLVGAVNLLATGQGKLGVEYSVGGPFLGLKGSATTERKSDGSWTPKAGVEGTAVTAKGNIDTTGAGVSNNHPLGLGRESAKHEWGKGTSTEQTDISDPFGGFHNETVTTKPDGTRTIADSRPTPSSLPYAL